MNKILIVYQNHSSYPLRKTIEDHLFSFKKYATGNVYYLNTAFSTPKYITKIPFDLILFHTILLGDLRWTELTYEEWCKKLLPLKSLSGMKAILPQDEFLCSDRICRFIKDFDVKRVFSVAPESEWNKIYPGIDRDEVKFHHVLTGYLDKSMISTVGRLTHANSKRDIDISYRSWHAEYWLGRHGLLKTQIADAFEKAALSRPLNSDISTKSEDTFLGLDWYRFLLRSKYVIGVEGGGSVLDFDGSIRKKTYAYLEKHPEATFEEVEKECFPGEDGKLRLFAISPRHLEACLTKTCQILIEGGYHGILRPGVHYIELKKDFSNLEEVLDLVEKDEARHEMVERAYQDVIQNGEVFYQSFVDTIVKQCSGNTQKLTPGSRVDPIYYLNKARESLLWLRIATVGAIKKYLPQRIVNFLKMRGS